MSDEWGKVLEFRVQLRTRPDDEGKLMGKILSDCIHHEFSSPQRKLKVELVREGKVVMKTIEEVEWE